MITYSIYTDIGNREKNEDSVSVYLGEQEGAFFLADGLGGHGKGEYASRLAVETAKGIYENGWTENMLIASFEEAQKQITAQQNEDSDFSDMKTTLVVLEIGRETIKWGHIGDSRLYYFSKNRLVAQTLDHSVPQMLVASGKIKEKDIRGHEDRNRLLRVLGSPWNKNKYDISEEMKRREKQAFLLCSDGFWELIHEKDMKRFLKKSGTVDEWLAFMVKEVKANGAGVNMDNNSAIAVWID